MSLLHPHNICRIFSLRSLMLRSFANTVGDINPLEFDKTHADSFAGCVGIELRLRVHSSIGELFVNTVPVI